MRRIAASHRRYGAFGLGCALAGFIRGLASRAAGPRAELPCSEQAREPELPWLARPGPAQEPREPRPEAPWDSPRAAGLPRWARDPPRPGYAGSPRRLPGAGATAAATEPPPRSPSGNA